MMTTEDDDRANRPVITWPEGEVKMIDCDMLYEILSK